jgi:PilZ domain
MQERRAFNRYQVRIGGKLIAPDMSTCAEVAIHDLSEDGAFVTSMVPAQLPERVYLWEAHTGTIFECTIKWRKRDKLFGLHFSDGAGRARRCALIAAVTGPSREEPFRIPVAPRPRMAVAARARASQACATQPSA